MYNTQCTLYNVQLSLYAISHLQLYRHEADYTHGQDSARQLPGSCEKDIHNKLLVCTSVTIRRKEYTVPRTLHI